MRQQSIEPIAPRARPILISLATLLASCSVAQQSPEVAPTRKQVLNESELRSLATRASLTPLQRFSVYNDLGAILMDRHEYTEARSWLDKGYALAVTLPRRDPRPLVAAIVNITDLLTMQSDYAELEKFSLRAFNAVGANGLAQQFSLVGLGRALSSRGDHASAELLLRVAYSTAYDEKYMEAGSRENQWISQSLKVAEKRNGQRLSSSTRWGAIRRYLDSFGAEADPTARELMRGTLRSFILRPGNGDPSDIIRDELTRLKTMKGYDAAEQFLTIANILNSAFLPSQPSLPRAAEALGELVSFGETLARSVSEPGTRRHASLGLARIYLLTQQTEKVIPHLDQVIDLDRLEQFDTSALEALRQRLMAQRPAATTSELKSSRQKGE